jgi:hypothetical protein
MDQYGFLAFEVAGYHYFPEAIKTSNFRFHHATSMVAASFPPDRSNHWTYSAQDFIAGIGESGICRLSLF